MRDPYLGRIEVSLNAISSIVGQAVLECYGVVGMTPKDSREYVTAHLPRAKLRRGVHLKQSGGQIFVEVFVIVEYGTRVSEVATGIKNRVKYVVERYTGLPVAAVNVHVKGLRVSQDG
jgi:uncharacterized alkaline shock family protein YloU